MTAPAEKLVELLETLPPETRQEITAWLLGRTTPVDRRALLASSALRGHSLIGPPDLGADASSHGLLGGSLPAGEESQLVTFRLPTERHAELRAWCTEHGFTMAAVVRGLIERFLEDQQRR
ncbi:hypothetical protein [Dactylosporangium matsuzakiense]|uniref:Uncharacterized protein n=1 Tax=Dactylosporangium matsuzakiense TaxID=53360 RepID=A0A9W6KIA8_9ACTN|nr:hypothetical protein [Dactylosporangium matsuzakiense]UWZ46339.1 hypothetical protein Dmats_07880 [Dactylosporangium matsuzakiense]GLL02048.1 hypothetical protein GCM10017581_037900 [Dactylosporangium matsuzakiense]